MNRVEIIYENEQFGTALKLEFADQAEIEFIDRSKKDADEEADNIDDYLPQPKPTGAGPDIVITLNDFIVAFVVTGSYDLLKFTLFKAIEVAKRYIQEDKERGIQIITDNGLSMQRIVFIIPYRKEITTQQLEEINANIKEIDKNFRKFLSETQVLRMRWDYKFIYDFENGWELENKD